MMASAQVVETSVNTNNSPSQDYSTNPEDHSNHNIDSPGFKPFTVIELHVLSRLTLGNGIYMYHTYSSETPDNQVQYI